MSKFIFLLVVINLVSLLANLFFPTIFGFTHFTILFNTLLALGLSYE